MFHALSYFDIYRILQVSTRNSKDYGYMNEINTLIMTILQNKTHFAGIFKLIFFNDYYHDCRMFYNYSEITRGKINNKPRYQDNGLVPNHYLHHLWQSLRIRH